MDKDMYDRKPNVETESLRVWTPKDEFEKEKFKKEMTDEENIILEKGDMKFSMGGFKKEYNKDGKLIFAYKIKLPHEKIILIYNPKVKGEEEEVEGMINAVKKLAEMTNLEVRDVEDVINQIENDSGLWKMATEEKDEKSK